MGERKVISKYYPPDFDPSIIPRRRKPKGTQAKVNMMIDFKLKCNNCGNYHNPGTKFNSRKETVENETYLGIKVYRFYIRCKQCHAEMTFKTDPKNSCYVAELNCTKVLMPWDRLKKEHVFEVDGEDEEQQDAMQLLEHKTISSKKEMEDLDALQELKELRHDNHLVSTDQLLETVDKKHAERAEAAAKREEDELQQELEKRFIVRRVEDEQDYVQEPENKPETTISSNNVNPQVKKRKADDVFGLVSIEKPKKKKKKAETKNNTNALSSLVAAYGDDD